MRWILAALLGVTMAIGPVQAAGVLRIGTQEDPDRLDPALGGTFGGRLVFAALCDKLVDLKPDLGFAPQLATAWSWSADGRALTLTLRDGVNFHDGEKMTAEAVAWNLERYRTAPDSVRKGELKPVAAVEVIDPHTVRIVLAQPYAPLIAVLSDRAGMMVSPKAAQRLGKDFFTAPVCSGPFSFVERIAQDRIVMDRFPGYWNAPSIHFDRVIVRPIPNSSVRLVGLQAGDLDILQDLGPPDAAKVRADPKLRLVSSTGLAFSAIAFNLANGSRADNPFGKDARVRAALEAAIDRNVINQVAMDGLFVPNNQTELPTSPFHNNAIPLPPRDVAHAKALLKAAGVEHAVLELRVPNAPRDTQVGEIVQAMAAEAGIEVKVVVGESNANTAAINRGDFQATLNNWSGRADPDVNISIYLACEGFQNWGKYCPPDFNDALSKARAETELTKRAALYNDVVSIYTRDRPMLVLYNVTALFAHVAGLKGFVPVPDGLVRVQGLSLE